MRPIPYQQDPRDPLLHSERTQGFAADPDYWKGEMFAYVGLPQNLKDLKDRQPWTPGRPGYLSPVRQLTQGERSLFRTFGVSR